MCIRCPNGTFADAPGSSSCSPCADIGQYLITVRDGATSASLCVCQSGYYSNGVVSRTTNEPCILCDPLTMECPAHLPGECCVPVRLGVVASDLLSTRYSKLVHDASR